MMYIIGIWIAAFLTLCIFSFLYKDNPFYKLAEHIYIGSSAAYMFIYVYFFDVKPMLIDKFRTSVGFDKWILIIPSLLGIIMLLRVVPRIGWISRWAIAFTIGLGSGIGIVTGVHGFVLPQIKATFVPLIVMGNWMESINNLVLIVGTLTATLYFYFSKEHKGAIRLPIRIGISLIMVAFGASFGYTVMARLSLLIGRIYFLLHDWLHLVK
ncbi:MAG: hypothetical protein HY769_07660 [Candidatus Stahlbacteria bacterium]|nr:hypothetical protein [Candidatus Stahlbacteria bacterium]